MKTLSDTAEKKNNVMIYGLKEKILPMRTKRKKKKQNV